MSSDTFFITTAIDYTNGAPHIGHAYEKVLADVMARYQRLAGKEVFFLTGVDQHGQKVQQSAEKEGVAPQEFVDRVTQKFVDLWQKLDVRYDAWAATTTERHKTVVRAILQRLWDDLDPATGKSRWIYKDKRAGYYSVRQEQFLTDKERGEDGEFGPEWGQVEFREEENYYFRLNDHKQWLLDLIDRRSGGDRPLVIPTFRAAELRNAVEKLTGDLCISRPKARLEWGISFPFDPDFVTYVWFDALVNYISFAPGYDPAAGAILTEFSRWWPALHVIGKDILIPAHGVYWPIMLKSLGVADDDIPALLVHGWWNISGEKMSKSVGNVVDPNALADTYGSEALRYYLMSDITTGRDADFTHDRLILRLNGDLGKNLGNLLQRGLTMVHKFRQGKLAKFQHPGDVDIEAVANNHVAIWRERFEGRLTRPDGVVEKAEPWQIHLALAAAFDLSTHCNQFIDSEKPWALAKDPAEADRLDAVLYHLCDSLRIIAILISPVLPKAAASIWEQLSVSGRIRLADAKWGGLPDGHVINAPSPLFPVYVAPKAE